MNDPTQQTIIIAIVTAILSGIVILRNLNEIMLQIKRILNEYAEGLRLKNERDRNEIQEQRLRVAFWMRAIQTGYAEEKLKTLSKGIKDGNPNA